MLTQNDRSPHGMEYPSLTLVQESKAMQLEPWRAETKIQSAYCPLSFLLHNQLHSSPTFSVYVLVLTGKSKEESFGKDIMFFLVMMHSQPLSLCLYLILYCVSFVFDTLV